MNDIKKIFEEIDRAIEETKSVIPVSLEDSRFLKRYIKIKEKWMR